MTCKLGPKGQVAVSRETACAMAWETDSQPVWPEWPEQVVSIKR